MTSAIDPTKPSRGATTTAGVRANFRAAKEEIEALQAAGEAHASDLAAHAQDTANPHAVTKEQVGLGNVPDVDATDADNLSRGTVPLDRLAVFGASGSAHAPGIVPDPGADAGNERFLCEDGEFGVPAGTPALTEHVAEADPHPQYMTSAETQSAIAALVASSPAALDTLNELAAALGNDPNFATTITNALALKAPLASPALTGVPTAPTAAAATNTTQLATTAFVQALAAALVAPLAPLASPALTGVPTAPTPGAGNNSTQIATTAFVQALAVTLATLASPALTGTPTAPTAAGGNNTTQLATTAFVQAALASGPGLNALLQAISALSTSADKTMYFTGPNAPALTAMTALARTLLANAAASDMRTTLGLGTAAVADIATLAPLASPALTGTPTAPTAGAGTNTTQLATTAFVASCDAAEATARYNADVVEANARAAADGGKANLNTNFDFVNVWNGGIGASGVVNPRG